MMNYSSFTVLHDGLPSKLKHYDIEYKIWQWISNIFLKIGNKLIDKFDAMRLVEHMRQNTIMENFNLPIRHTIVQRLHC